MVAVSTETQTKIVHAACPHDCPDTCAMLVTVQDGKVTRVGGDPDHPFTRGGLCAKVNDYDRHAYHPDRLLHPMRRVGPKGEGRFERISWDEAIGEVCGRFRQIVGEYGGQAIMPYSYLGNMGILNGLNVADPFMHRLGATVCERTTCSSCRSASYVMTLGPAYMDPESFAYSKYIIIWGCNMMSTNLHMWPFIREAQKKGAKVVVIDPHRTKTAKKADWHIAIRPGTDGALALGLMRVLIDEGLTDDDYIARHTVGFDELRQRVAEYPVERVAEITGIPADEIRTLAREYASTPPAAIRVGVALENHPQGGQAYRAILSLPALVGAWRHVGGGVLEMPLWAFPVQWDVLSKPEWITPGTRVVNMLKIGAALTGETPLDPPIKALVVYNANPAVVSPDQNRILKGLAREDLFTVVSEQFMTDTARYADIVLPATTALEHFDIMFSWGHLYVTLNLPAIEPQGEAVSNTELFRRLAAGMGFDDEWFSLTDEDFAVHAFDWDAPVMKGVTLEGLRECGWAKLTLPSPDTFAPYTDGGFPTPSGKVELYSSLAAEQGDFVIPVFRQGYTEFQDGSPVDPLPSYRPTEPRDDYPLLMMTSKAHAFLNSQYANMDRQRRIEGEEPVLIMNEVDAERRKILDGQRVRAFNEWGEFRAIARVGADVLPGALVQPFGHWVSHASGESTSSATLGTEHTDIGHGAHYSEAYVEVEPIYI